MTISELKNQINDLKTQLVEDSRVDSLNKEDSSGSKLTRVSELTTKYLGKKGLFNNLVKQLAHLDSAEKPSAGQLLNQLKAEIEQTLSQIASKTNSKAEWVDLTIPGIKPDVGHTHPISQAIEEITAIFERIGFTRVSYPEVDWDWYVFEALNMPPNHPARDEWETFFVEMAPNPTKGRPVLTTHTSNGQVREMERLGKPPIRMINIGRTYRRQQDATHTQVFHQFEGLVIDKGINIQHLKGTIDNFAHDFYGPGVKSRIRPFHFKFTEPSFEVDFSCHICNGTGFVGAHASTGERVSGDTSGGSTSAVVSGGVKVDTGEDASLDAAKPTKCRFCKSGWHEVGGAGMVHPNVLRAGGIDPDQYTGFAFGWGVERSYSLKKGLNIDDIRQLYSSDLRFLEQF